MKALNNHLLIAMPNLKDSIFNESVVLICDHNTDGTMGLILNKPIDEEIAINKISKEIKTKIYFGGPVNLDICFILHDSTYHLKKSQPISENLYSTSNKKIIEDINNGVGPVNFKFNMGYSGWSAGQLEKEIKNGDWLIIPNPQKFIFDIPDEQKWNFMIDKLGLDINDNWDSSGGQA